MIAMCQPLSQTIAPATGAQFVLPVTRPVSANVGGGVSVNVGCWQCRVPLLPLHPDTNAKSRTGRRDRMWETSWVIAKA